MKKTPLRILIARKKEELRTADPKSRDRIRHELHVLLRAAQLRKESRAA